MAGKFKALQVLQPSATDETILVGPSGRKSISQTIVDSKKRRLNFDFENTPSPRSKGTLSKTPLRDSGCCVDRPKKTGDGRGDSGDRGKKCDTPRKTGKPATVTNDKIIIHKDAYDLSVSDNRSAMYWKKLAEERRFALEVALKENEHLHREVELLQAENEQLQKIANYCGDLAELVDELTVDSEETKEES